MASLRKHRRTKSVLFFLRVLVSLKHLKQTIITASGAFEKYIQPPITLFLGLPKRISYINSHHLNTGRMPDG